MAELDNQERENLLAFYGNISRQYNSAISHSLTLITAWLAFIYASKAISLDPFPKIIIVVVLSGMGLYSWIRIALCGRMLYRLETSLGIAKLTEFKQLFQTLFHKQLFTRRTSNSFTNAEKIISVALTSFYVFSSFIILS